MHPSSFYTYIAGKLGLSLDQVRRKHTLYQLECMYDIFREQESDWFQKMAWVIRAAQNSDAKGFESFIESL